MSFKNEKWNLNRRPNRFERVFGSIFSLAIFLITLVLLKFSISHLLTAEEISKQGIAVFLFALLCFLGSIYLCFRVIFTRAQKPNPLAIMITGYFVLCISCAFLLFAVSGLGSGKSFNIYLVSIGLTGLAGSIAIIKQNRSNKF